MCGPGVGCVNVDVLEIGNVAGRYAEAMGLGGACDEGIIQFQRASGTLRLYSELGRPLRRGLVRGQDAILLFGGEAGQVRLQAVSLPPLFQQAHPVVQFMQHALGQPEVVMLGDGCHRL